jgi:hypothetical protein
MARLTFGRRQSSAVCSPSPLRFRATGETKPLFSLTPQDTPKPIRILLQITVPATDNDGACGADGGFTSGERVALLLQRIELLLLVGDTLRGPLLVIPAGIGRSLLYEVPQIVLEDGDPLIEFGARRVGS